MRFDICRVLFPVFGLCLVAGALAADPPAQTPPATGRAKGREALEVRIAQLEKGLSELSRRVGRLHEQVRSLQEENGRLRLRLDILTSGHPLGKLKVGMSQKEVEQILRRPERRRDEEEPSNEGAFPTKVATYYVRIPNHPGEQLMTVHYRQDKGRWAFHEWRGPHFPD
jgi:regulator of replication initiation timing